MTRMPIPAALLLAALLVLGACTSAAAPTPTPTLMLSPTPTPGPETTPGPTPEPTPTTTATPSPSPPPTLEPTPASSPISMSAETVACNFGFLGACENAVELYELGARWDRPHPGPFIWGRIEHAEGQYDWREADDYVRDAQSHGLATLATVWPFAEWDQASWGPPGTPLSTGEIVFEYEMGRDRRKPHDMDAYKRFVSALVERYDGDGENDMPGLEFPIKYWEAGNEPSMQDGFNMFFDGSSEDYLEILEATYQTVGEVDPEAKVLQAGMAGMDTWMVSFWEPVFENGSQYFDIANIHSIGASDELNVPEFRALLSRYGIDKPIWVTEAQHRIGRAFDGGYVSEEEHGRIFARSYVLSFAYGVDKIFYTSFRQLPVSPPEMGDAALVDKNGVRRPAYYALQTLILKLDGFTSAERLAEGQYRFVVGEKTIHVLWGSGGLPAGITGDVLVTDILGTETGTSSHTVSLSDSPVFVEMVD